MNFKKPANGGSFSLREKVRMRGNAAKPIRPATVFLETP
jgi:hypothetical protein